MCYARQKGQSCKYPSRNFIRISQCAVSEVTSCLATTFSRNQRFRLFPWLTIINFLFNDGLTFEAFFFIQCSISNRIYSNNSKRNWKQTICNININLAALRNNKLKSFLFYPFENCLTSLNNFSLFFFSNISINRKKYSKIK